MDAAVLPRQSTDSAESRARRLRTFGLHVVCRDLLHSIEHWVTPISTLLVQHANRTSDLLVFPNDAGNRDTHILEKLKMVCRRAGIKQSTVHALRHSFATHLRMQGVSLADIGELLGHADLASTQIYAKVYQEYLRGVVTRLNPLMGTDAGMNLVSPAVGAPVAVLEYSKEE